MGDELRADRLPGRRSLLRSAEQPPGQKAAADFGGAGLRDFVAGNRAGCTFHCLRCVENAGRVCNRTGLRRFADVYCRDFSGVPARATGFTQPVSHRCWNFAGAGGELADCKTGAGGRDGARDSCFVERTMGMALDVWCNRDSFSAVSGGEFSGS